MQLASASCAKMDVTASMASFALSTKDTWSIRRNCHVNKIDKLTILQRI
jgi:hypothetical protein